MIRTRRFHYYLAASAAVVTFLVYLVCLKNGFVYWDDDVYVLNNPYIRTLNTDFFLWAFSGFYAANWHPLTWISHAVDYALWGFSPAGHHLSSIVLHALNTFLVALLVTRLLDSYNARAAERTNSVLSERTVLTASAVTGLLFGLHPIHVESAAWIAERKDLLCALFFMLSILSYLHPAQPADDGIVRKTRPLSLINSRYLLSLFFFLCALMSKPMAVTLPFVLLILDWFPLQKIRSWRTLWTAAAGKIPFFALSAASSVVTVMAQKSGTAVWEAVPFSVRAAVAAGSLVAYLGKMIVPLDLLPFYPYPLAATLFSVKYLAAVAALAAATIACLAVAKTSRIWTAVWCYYVLTLVPVLGLVQVGGQAFADRYAYLPSIGPFLLAGLGTAWASVRREERGQKKAVAGQVVLSCAAVVIVCLSFLTFKQIRIWQNDITLWTHVIDRESTKAILAYLNRGNAFARAGRYPEAIEDFSTVITWNYREDSQLYITRGLAYYQLGRMDLAARDLNRACELGDDFGCKAKQYFAGPDKKQ